MLEGKQGLCFHIMVKHTGEISFICDECEKRFGSNVETFIENVSLHENQDKLDEKFLDSDDITPEHFLPQYMIEAGSVNPEEEADLEYAARQANIEIGDEQGTRRLK